MFDQVAEAESSPCKTLSYSFSSKWRNNAGELKILLSPKVKGSRMPLVRAVYNGLLRCVAALSNQGRNDGGQRAQFPWRRKVLTMSQVSYFNAVHLLPKELRFEHGAPNLFLALGAI